MDTFYGLRLGRAQPEQPPLLTQFLIFQKPQKPIAANTMLNDVFGVCSSLEMQHLLHRVPAHSRGRLMTTVSTSADV